MRPGVSLLTAIALEFGTTIASPSLGNMSAFIKQNQSDDQFSTELIGDLKTLDEKQLTSTGRYIKAILQDREPPPEPDDALSYPTPLPAKDSDSCRSNTCCIWRHMYLEMAEAMKDIHGNCNDMARAAIRLGFHDAGTWSISTGPLGGADGSIILAGECESRSENNGLQTVCEQTRRWFEGYRQYGIGMADLIQFAHNVGTKLCLTGPTVPTFVGRKDRSTASPEGTLPTQDQSAEELIALFENKTISPLGLVALVGAHTSAKQFFVDTTRAGASLDASPEIWDTGFYDEVLAESPPQGVFRLQSDTKLSKHPRTVPAWMSFTGFLGTFPWHRDYNREYVRLSLLGVNNINDLTVCAQAVLEPDGPSASTDSMAATSTIRSSQSQSTATSANGNSTPSTARQNTTHPSNEPYKSTRTTASTNSMTTTPVNSSGHSNSTILANFSTTYRGTEHSASIRASAARKPTTLTGDSSRVHRSIQYSKSTEIPTQDLAGSSQSSQPTSSSGNGIAGGDGNSSSNGNTGGNNSNESSHGNGNDAGDRNNGGNNHNGQTGSDPSGSNSSRGLSSSVGGGGSAPLTPIPATPVGSNTLTENSQSQFGVGSITLVPGGSVVTLGDSTIASPTSGSGAVINGSTTQTGTVMLEGSGSKVLGVSGGLPSGSSSGSPLAVTVQPGTASHLAQQDSLVLVAVAAVFAATFNI